MKWTSAGRCNDTVSKTEGWMARFLPSEEPKAFSFSIEELGQPGVVIGSAGCFSSHGEHPQLGYIFQKETWGRGYAIEAVKAILEAYWGLGRREVDVENQDEVGMGQEGDGVQQGNATKSKALAEGKNAAGFQVETLLAATDVANAKSRRVLEKLGFVNIGEYRDWDTGGTECVRYILRRPGS